MTRADAKALFDYREDVAGGLMNPRFARLRPEQTIDQAITYLRQQLSHVETIYYAYVLDEGQRLVGVVSLKDLVKADPNKTVADVMTSKLFKVSDITDQEQIAHLLTDHGIQSIPVVDAQGCMKGIVTADDVIDVIREEDTRDIQKVGGMEALDGPYLETGFGAMLRKRAGWLVILFLGEMLTATAMTHYEHQIEEAVVLALFIPLLISSGGNSGSQATTLIIRAMALGELRQSCHKRSRRTRGIETAPSQNEWQHTPALISLCTRSKSGLNESKSSQTVRLATSSAARFSELARTCRKSVMPLSHAASASSAISSSSSITSMGVVAISAPESSP
jgi:Mg2+ transporter MgtE